MTSDERLIITTVSFVIGLGVGFLSGPEESAEPIKRPGIYIQRAAVAHAEWERLRQRVDRNCETILELNDVERRRANRNNAGLDQGEVE